MSDYIRFFFLSVFCLSLFCQSQKDPSQEAQILLETDKQFAQTSLEVGAAEAFHQFLDADALMLPDGSHPVYGLESIYQRMSKGNPDADLSWEPQKAEVARSCDLGYTWGTYQYTVKHPDVPDSVLSVSYGKYLNVWKRQTDGSWKVLIDMGNGSPGL